MLFPVDQVWGQHVHGVDHGLARIHDRRSRDVHYGHCGGAGVQKQGNQDDRH